MSVSHVAYGLRLAVDIAVPGLTPLSDVEAADVRIWLKESSTFPATLLRSREYCFPSPDFGDLDQPVLRVAVDAERKLFGFFYGDGVRFAVERNGREVWVDWPEDLTLEDASTYLLGPVMGFVLRLRGITCLHASAVAVGDSAVAFLGFPGAGKSTLAAAFGRAGFAVLSDDVVALVDEGGRFLVQPGYPRVNLWPDSVCWLFGSESALPTITPTWDKRFLALDQNGCRFATEPLPLAAIYVLGEREGLLGASVIEEVRGNDAFVTLVANTYVNYLLDRVMRSREFDTLSRVLDSIPVRRLRLTTNPLALEAICKMVAADAALSNSDLISHSH